MEQEELIAALEETAKHFEEKSKEMSGLHNGEAATATFYSLATFARILAINLGRPHK